MKILPLLTPLLLLAVLPTSASAQGALAKDGPTAGRVVPVRFASDPIPPTPLRRRLDAARIRSAPKTTVDHLDPRVRLRIQRMRPLGRDNVGSLDRRRDLGDRQVTSAADKRLGSKWRRDLLAGRAIRPVPRRY